MRPPSERSDTIPAITVKLEPDLTMAEHTDLAEGATRRAMVTIEPKLRGKSNARVTAQLESYDRKVLAESLTSATLKVDGLEVVRRRLYYALGSLALAVAGLIADKIARGTVDDKAHAAAVEVVEERATPIEERAAGAAAVSTEAAARQAELERREADRDARLERLIEALEAEHAAPR